MRRAIRWMARLYPRKWRERYGAEFDALLGQTNPGWAALADVGWGAIKTRLGQWGGVRITLACAVAGALFTTGLSFVVPERYSSHALIRIDGDDGPAALDAVSMTALSRRELMNLVNIFGLYPGERSQRPLQEVILNMRDHIHLTPVGGAANRVAGVTVAFDYPNPFLAQRVTQRLVDGLIRGNLIAAANGGHGANFELIDPASFSSRSLGPQRDVQIGCGVLTGLLAGLIMAAIARRRRHIGVCPTCGHALTAVPRIGDESVG